MASFVTDSTVLTPGLLDPRSAERRLLTLCAYGRLRRYSVSAEDEVDDAPEVRAGNAVSGRSVRELQQGAGLLAAALADRLPPGAPEDCQLVLSTPLLDEFEKSLQRMAVGGMLAMTVEFSARHRLIATTLATTSPTISVSTLPERSGIRVVDLLFETAAQGRAEFVVSDSPQLEPFLGQDLRLPDEAVGETRVCSFESFLRYTGIDERIEEVDGALLSFALSFWR